MLILVHAKSHIDVDPCGGHQRASFSLSRGDPRGLGRAEDSRVAAGPGRPAPWVDNGGFGPNPHESKPMDPRCEQRGFRGLKAQAQLWQANALIAQASEGSAGPLGEIASRVWLTSSPVGWAHFSDPLKALLRDKSKSETGSEVDASAGIPNEEGQLLLSSSPSRTGQEVPEGFKKNLTHWGPGRRWFSRTRQALPCTPVWVGGGPEGEGVFAFQLPVNIASA